MTKLKLKFNSLAGFVDPISIIGVLFLIVTLVVGTKVTNDRSMSLNISEKAAKLEKTGNAAFDKCREESGREVCNERLGTNINWKGEDKTVYEQPVAPAPEAPAAIVPTSNTLEKEEIDFINKVSKEQAVVQQPKQESPVVVINNELEKEEAVFINEVAQQETKQQAVVQQPSQQPITTTIQTNSFANVTAGVSGGTMQEVPTITSNQINQYVPPLLTTVPTAEDLLKKLPGLENLNINDFKELNYPTINKPDPAIITNKYGIVGAYANDPVRCKYGNGAIKEGDGKYACPTDTFANPILDNSQNISWYDQPLDIPALEFNLESTEPTVESEIKKLTDPLFNYILDYFNWGIIDKITTSGQNVTEGAGSETALPKLPSDIKDIPSGFSDYTDSSENHVETLRGGKELFIDISGTVKLITDKNMNEQFYTVPDKVDYIQTNVTDSKGELIEQKVFWIAPTDVAQSTGNPTIVMENRNYSTNTHRYTYYEANLEDNITDSWAVVYSGGCVLPSCVNKVATWWENQKIKATFIWDDILGQPHSMPSP